MISFIVSGHLKPGMPLPSIRALASDLSCSVITVNRAYQNLEQRKFIETVQGKGTFVANIQAEEKQHVADESLHQAFRAAVEMSLRLQNDEARTRETFEKVLAEILKERGINR